MIRPTADPAAARALLPPDLVIKEHAYLVHRGVRAMALVEVVRTTPEVAFSIHYYLRASTTLEGGCGAIPFAVAGRDGFYYCGFAGAPWVVRLLEAAVTEPKFSAWSHQIMGLLLGYSAAAIQDHENRSSGEPIVPRVLGSAASTGDGR